MHGKTIWSADRPDQDAPVLERFGRLAPDDALRRDDRSSSPPATTSLPASDYLVHPIRHF